LSLVSAAIFIPRGFSFDSLLAETARSTTSFLASARALGVNNGLCAPCPTVSRMPGDRSAGCKAGASSRALQARHESVHEPLFGRIGSTSPSWLSPDRNLAPPQCFLCLNSACRHDTLRTGRPQCGSKPCHGASSAPPKDLSTSGHSDLRIRGSCDNRRGQNATWHSLRYRD
jgi:hypothetical protein